MRGIHQRPVNSPHKWPVTRKMFPFDDVIMMFKRIIYKKFVGGGGGVSNMLLVLSSTFHCHYIWGCMCSTGPFQFGDWKDIFISHVIIIIKSEVSTLTIVVILFCGCVPEMFVTSYSVTYCIYITQFMMSANSRIRFGLQIVFVCLYITPSHYYHCANLSADIELIKCL